MRKIALATLVLAATLSGPADPAQTVQKPYGGTLVIGFDHKPTLINPVLTTHSASAGILGLVFNGLVRLNSIGEIEPDLAEKWEVSEDGRVYTFHLRRGVRFHDGVELTSEDVRFTYERILDPSTGSPFASDLAMIRGLETPDPYTFRVRLDAPKVSLIYEFNRKILPRRLYEGTEIAQNAHNYAPVGTGPFRFSAWGPDDRIVLVANLDYFEGRPNLDRVIYKVYPDRSEVWRAFMRQEIDLVIFVRYEDYRLIEKDPSFKGYNLPSPHHYALFYNLELEPTNDQNVRMAINEAIDRRDLIDTLENSYGLEAGGPFALDLNQTDSASRSSFNPSKAIARLKAIGWEDADGNGILEKDGKELAITLLIDSRIDKMRSMAKLVRQHLQAVGIKAIINPSNLDEIVPMKKANACLASILGFLPELHEVVKEWHSSNDRPGKLWPYHNARVDELIEKAQSIGDSRQRQTLYLQVYDVVNEDQPASFLYFPYFFHAVSRRFDGVENYLNPFMPDSMIKEFSVSADKT